MGMPQRMPFRTPSSGPGETFAVFVIATGSTPGCIDSSSMPAPITSGGRGDVPSR